jgi:hypothetical protein
MLMDILSSLLPAGSGLAFQPSMDRLIYGETATYIMIELKSVGGE